MRLVAARRRRGRSPARTSSCRSPTRWTAAPATPRAPATAAEPAGWVWNPDPERDYRLNILLLHDDAARVEPRRTQPALAAAGYDPAGLYATVTVDGRPILCAACHASNALPGTGISGIPPLTRAVHALHAGVQRPD